MRFFTSTWQEWDGAEFPSESPDSIVYVAEGWVDLDNIPAQKDLARVIQQDGITEGYTEAAELVAAAESKEIYAFAAHYGSDYTLTYLQEYEDISEDPDNYDHPIKMTFVEISDGS
jgi:hypothetical protein